MMTEVLDLEPAVVTIRFGFNDHSPAARPELRLHEPASPLLRGPLYRLADWRLFHLGVLAFRNVPFLHPAPGSVPRVPQLRFERNLERFVEVTRARGIHLLLLDYPIRESRDDGYLDRTLHRILGVRNLRQLETRHARYQDAQRAVALRTGTPLLDTWTSCRRSSGGCFGDYDVVHPSDEGARLAAALMFEALVELGWLGAPSGADDPAR